MHFQHFDLVAHEEQYGHKPVFTRALLKQIANQKCILLQEMCLRDELRKNRTLEHHDANGQSLKVWRKGREPEQAESLTVYYMPRIATHPDFQKRFGDYTKQLPLLRRYNDLSNEAYITIPYALDPIERDWRNEHQDDAMMRAYRNVLSHSKKLWMQSKSRTQLENTIVSAI